LHPSEVEASKICEPPAGGHPECFELLYGKGMSRRDPERASEARDETFIDERGVMLSRAGVERAGERLADSQARHTPSYFAALRERLGVVPRSA